jgi:hypothetical protein
MSEQVAENPQIEVLDAAPKITTEVAEYTKTAAGLADLHRRYGNVAWTVDTKKDEDAARAVRRELVSLRTGLDKLRKDMNADDQARIALRNTEAKRITALIEALEAPVDEAIKAKEDRIEREKQERLQAEAARIAALRASIDDIASVATRASSLSSPAELDRKIEMLVRVEITEAAFSELKDQAFVVKAEALRRLEDLKVSAVAREAAEAKAQRDAEELEKLRAEAAQREADEAAERSRVLAERHAREARQRLHDDFLADLRQQMRGTLTCSADQVSQKIEAVKAMVLPAGLDDLAATAELAKADTLEELTELHAVVVRREEEQHVARAEADRVQRQADEVAAAQKRIDDAEAQKEVSKRADFLDRTLQGLATEEFKQLMSGETAAIIEPKTEGSPELAKAFDDIAALEPSAAQFNGWTEVQEPDLRDTVDPRPDIKLGDIAARLGFPLSESFVTEVLNIKPAGFIKRSVMFRAADFDEICFALTQHIIRVTTAHRRPA